MFKDVKELKEFILWAKQQRIQQFTVGDTQIVLSTLAFMDDIASLSQDTPSKPESEGERLLREQKEAKEYEELLMHSAGG